jgi:16S rRNA (uracil1498-N3)-methyltransferase
MELQRFFLEILMDTSVVGEEVLLSEEESHHASRVLRLRAGDSLLLVDGGGHLTKAHILEAHPKRMRCQIVEIERGQDKPPAVHLAVAPTKNISRFEWLLEKATEIGLGSITPLQCERSERQFLKMERLRKVLISAMKQSRRSWLPQLNPLTPLAEFLNAPLTGQGYIAFLGDQSLPLQGVHPYPSPASIMIGPEGDFSAEECLAAKQRGFQPVSLGQARLRTETAALIACAIINTLNESSQNEKA